MILFIFLLVQPQRFPLNKRTCMLYSLIQRDYFKMCILTLKCKHPRARVRASCVFSLLDQLLFRLRCQLLSNEGTGRIPVSRCARRLLTKRVWRLQREPRARATLQGRAGARPYPRGGPPSSLINTPLWLGGSPAQGAKLSSVHTHALTDTRTHTRTHTMSIFIFCITI